MRQLLQGGKKKGAVFGGERTRFFEQALTSL
jgi:hypothetical protein